MPRNLVLLLDATRESQLTCLAETCRSGWPEDLLRRLEVELSGELFIDIEDEANAGTWSNDKQVSAGEVTEGLVRRPLALDLSIEDIASK